MKQTDRQMIEMALVGYTAKRKRIDDAIAAIRHQIDGRAATPTDNGESKPKRILSPAAKRRIAAAQRKRWAAFHADQKGETAKTTPKHKPSAAAKAKVVRNLAKARAAKVAKTKKVAAAA